MSEKVTVLADKYGLQREYREVKRKAAVGERIKWENDGVVFTIEDSLSSYVTFRQDGIVRGLGHEEYVVLEPTDTVIIDGKRYKTVERKANVGERVVVTFARRDCFRVGEVRTVRRVETGERDLYSVDGPGIYMLRREDSRVLDTAATPEPQPDVLALIANLSTRLSAAERTLAELTAEKTERGASGPVSVGPPSYVTERPQTRPLTRDDVIEMAKEDIRSVKSEWNVRDDIPGGKMRYIFGIKVCTEKFIVNKEKRTVVCIMRWDFDNSIVSKGIAKCAPDDVFNASIGRAIALRRALGLDVPEEYVKAPKPERVQVGDIVLFRSTNSGRSFVTTLTQRCSYNDGNMQYGNDAFFHSKRGGWIGDKQYTVIDDSREETEASA